MLKIYVRHVAACSQKATDFRKCRCPKWIMGALPSGEFIRESTRQTSWEAAERIAHTRWDATLPGVTVVAGRHSVKDAVTSYLADQEARGFEASTQQTARTILKNQLLSWCAENGIEYLDELTTPLISSFRSFLRREGNSGTTLRKKHANLVTFFRFAISAGFLKENPISHKLKTPKADTRPTDWLTPEEYDTVLTAARDFTIKGIDQEHRGERVALLIQLMRWSGLALTDAITLERSRIDAQDRLFLYRQKTGVPVLVALPPELTTGLRALPSKDPRYFFWTGLGSKHTARRSWDRTLRRVFKNSGLEKRIHAHMLRDTFAVSLLLAGVPLDQVALLLGHSSTKTTEKHYAPFVAARQEQLLQAVQKTWPASSSAPPLEPLRKPESGSTHRPASSHRSTRYVRGSARPVHRGTGE